MRQLERCERRLASTLARAPPRSRPGVTLMPTLRRSSRSKRRVSSISAASPSRAHVRDDGGDRRVDVGGLLALQPSSALEAVLEIAVSGLEPRGHGAGSRVQASRGPGSSPGCSGFERVLPGGPEVLELGLDALDLEPDRGVAGEGEGDIAARAPRSARSCTASSDSTRSSALGLTMLELGAEHPLEIEAPSAAARSLVAVAALAPSPSRSG